MNVIPNKDNTARHAILFGAIIFLLLAVAGCASPPKQAITGTEVSNQQPSTTQAPVSALAQIAAKYTALDLDTQTAKSQSLIQVRNTELLALVDLNITNNDCISANIIISFIENSIVDEQNKAKANLFKSECLLQQLGKSSSQLNDAKNIQLLALLSAWTGELDEQLLRGEFSSRYAISKAKLAALNNDFNEALATLLMRTENLLFLGPQQANDLIWQWYSLLPEAQKPVLRNRFSALESVATLFDMIEDTSVNDSIRQASIRRWLDQNPNETLARQLPQQLARYLALDSIKQQRIAVLLPLSGRLSSQGEAIKQGLLAAYWQGLSQSSANTNQPTSEIEFIDTSSLPIISSDINADRMSQFDIIIGPLLKSHIEQVRSFNLAKVKQVVLNQSNDQGVDQNSPHNGSSFQAIGLDSTLPQQSITAYFALSPEQEAQQLVFLMRLQNIDNPVLIKDSSSTAKRMAAAFIQEWEKTAPLLSNTLVDKGQTKQTIQEISYTNNQSMRVGITSALDVLQSQSRIQQLSNLSQERVHSVTRNRRDIDAFVVFSRPDELELINPIIETSISLFTNKQLPVFAGSYSYDHKQSKNSQRDLRNLIFVDMPWVISSTRDDELSTQVDTLFNSPPSTFLRLFAFGFDALSIADNIAQLSTFDYMTINGLTGTLSLTDSKLLNRELAWMAITGDNAQSN